MTVAVEALECPTMLRNGFGEHNIQGIGDKHIPLIHDVMATDMVVAVSDRATDQLEVLFASPAGRDHLLAAAARPRGDRRGRSRRSGSRACATCSRRSRSAKYERLRPGRRHRDGGDRRRRDVRDRDRADPRRATSTASSTRSTPARRSGATSWAPGRTTCSSSAGSTATGSSTSGYFTWVEQQGVPLDEFEARRRPAFWTETRALLPVWDRLIDDVQRPGRRRGGGVTAPAPSARSR